MSSAVPSFPNHPFNDIWTLNLRWLSETPIDFLKLFKISYGECMNYWLIKSEPFKYSFDQLVLDKKTFWNGVRNFQARNNLRAMKKGDQAFFYHSNEGKEIVGIVEIVKEAYPDSTAEDGDWSMVDVKPLKKLNQPVTLETIKSSADLKNMALIKQSRLSVCPVTPQEFKIITKLGA